MKETREELKNNPLPDKTQVAMSCCAAVVPLLYFIHLHSRLPISPWGSQPSNPSLLRPKVAFHFLLPQPLPTASHVHPQMMSRQFFSTLHAMHLGLLPAIARLNAIYLSGRSRLAFIDRQRAAAEQRGQDNPRLVAEVDRLIAERCAFEADICNEGVA